jgi:hypothetical protein
MTNIKVSAAIHKNITDDKLKNILNNLPKNMEIDEQLQEKIINIYGSMDSYTQGN